MKDCIMLDMETLDTNSWSSAIVNLAILPFNEERFLQFPPYSLEELMNDAYFYKMDIADQIKHHNRTINNSTADWWEKQDREVRKQLVPSKDDIKLEDLYTILNEDFDWYAIKKVFARGPHFDISLLQSALASVNRDIPFITFKVRDTRTLIETLFLGEDIPNNFMPPGIDENILKHNPVVDVALDVMRYQTAVRAVYKDSIELEDDIPF